MEEAEIRGHGGEHRVQSRMALEARTWTPEGQLGIQVRALNDVTVHKGGYARVLRMRLSAGDEPIARLAADGVAEFMLVVSHPRLRGATGAWVAPLAVV